MAYNCGKLFLVQVEDLPANPGTYITIAGLESNSMTINKEQVDVTNKSNAPWRHLLEGCGTSSISVSGNGFVSDDATFQTIIQSQMAGLHLPLKLVSGLGDSFEGLFELSSTERNGDHNTAEKFSISAESAGEVTYTVAP